MWTREKPPLKRPIKLSQFFTRTVRLVFGAAIALLSVVGGIYTLLGPIWPTTPQISAQNGVGESSENLPFQITNESIIFKIRNAELSCLVDLLYFMDADFKTGLLRDEMFTEGATAIDPNVNYFCDAKFVHLLPDGSLETGFPEGQHMTTKAGAFRPPIKILKMCVQIAGSYTSNGVARQFRSAMFQWPAAPDGNQWVKGPIAFDTDQRRWIPDHSSVAGAWGLRALTQITSEGKVELLPDALRCDWEQE